MPGPRACAGDTCLPFPHCLSVADRWLQAGGGAGESVCVCLVLGVPRGRGLLGTQARGAECRLGASVPPCEGRVGGPAKQTGMLEDRNLT